MMARILARICGVLCLLLVITQQASAQDMQALIARLDRLERENLAVKARLDHLEHAQPRHSSTAQVRPSKLNYSKLPSAKPALVNIGYFDGPYVGVFGGTEISNGQRQPQPTPSYVCNFLSCYNAWSETGKRHGLIGSVFGYNYTIGSILIGAEGRIHYNLFRDEFNGPSSSSSNSLPVFVQSQTCFVCTPFYYNSPSYPKPTYNGDLYFSYSSRTESAVKKTFGGDASIRLGAVALENWLLYARSGLGVQLFDSTFTNTRDFTKCNGPIVTRTVISPISFSDSVKGCSSISTSHTVDVTTESSISPYITVGAGIERNFGRAFGRVEGEFIDYLGQFNGKTMQIQPFYETRFTAGAGYRF
jgi:opacity protein-like surface antigen